MIFLALVVRQFGNKKIENMFHIQLLNRNRNIQIIDTDFVSWGEKMGRNCEFHKGMICLHVEHLLGLPDPAAGRHALQVLGCLILILWGPGPGGLGLLVARRAQLGV